MHLIDPSSRAPLLELIEQGALPPEQIPAALEFNQLHPNRQQWCQLIDVLLLWLGGIALAFLLMFFIAYNWGNLGRFAKFALVEVFMAACIAAYWRWHQHAMVSKLTLLMACLGLDVLLALFGQTYQTGADPWELFFNWALLMLPWTLLARSPALWMLWLGLLNLSAILHQQVSRNTFDFLFPSDIAFMWTLLLLNTLALICWDCWLKNRTGVNGLATRVIAIAARFAATWLAFWLIHEKSCNSCQHIKNIKAFQSKIDNFLPCLNPIIVRLCEFWSLCMVSETCSLEA